MSKPRYTAVCLDCDPENGHNDGKPLSSQKWEFGARNALRIHADRTHGGEMPDHEIEGDGS